MSPCHPIHPTTETHNPHSFNITMTESHNFTNHQNPVGGILQFIPTGLYYSCSCVSWPKLFMANLGCEKLKNPTRILLLLLCSGIIVCDQRTHLCTRLLRSIELKWHKETKLIHWFTYIFIRNDFASHPRHRPLLLPPTLLPTTYLYLLCTIQKMS